ncbi:MULTISPECIES: RHS repeat domain-containing protein [unclassified Chryseobacterium]|uniref:RHS repeat domain-containing protein n=1 Tax=unclassified Chryseobacterium TaxID=2593645 RepID=UPI00300FA3C2
MGMYDYGARFYMPDLGRWGVVDPLAEKMPSWSPYNYTFDNPVKYTDPDGREPFNEYDKNGKMISNLGGNKIDFYHQRNGDTKVVSRETGASNIIKGGESIIRGYTHRGKDVGWGTITAEYFGGSGPARSLFSDFNDGPFASLDKSSSPYSSLARQGVLNSKNSKGVVKMDYLQANPITANFDFYEQMWGRSNISWYKLGDETLFLMTDSKSQESLFYRLPVNNFERTEGRVNSFGNTYQTYIWTESKYEVQQKAVNPTLKNVFKQTITPPSILTRPRF